MFKSIVAIAGFWALTACSTAPLAPVAYEGQTRAISDQKATIRLATGDVTGSTSIGLIMAGPTMFIPVVSGNNPEFYFNQDDQLAFIGSLADELNRLKLLHVTAAGINLAQTEPVAICVLFLKTHHNPNTQAYTLDVAVVVKGPEGTLINVHQVVSHEGLVEGLFVDASEGKKMAAQKLLNAIIPDVEKWVLAISEPE